MVWMCQKAVFDLSRVVSSGSGGDSVRRTEAVVAVPSQTPQAMTPDAVTTLALKTQTRTRFRLEL
jgi:hypothetical protein